MKKGFTAFASNRITDRYARPSVHISAYVIRCEGSIILPVAKY